MPRFAILAALPFLVGGAIAQGTPAPGTGPQRAPVHYPGVSAAGNALLTRQLQQGDPQLRTLVIQLRDTTKELQLALQRPVLDVEQFAALRRRGDGLQSRIRARQSDRILAALRALPAEDRAPFLRAIGSAPAAGGGAAAAVQPH